MCDDIGNAAYDKQGVAAALFERLLRVEEEGSCFARCTSELAMGCTTTAKRKCGVGRWRRGLVRTGAGRGTAASDVPSAFMQPPARPHLRGGLLLDVRRGPQA